MKSTSNSYFNPMINILYPKVCLHCGDLFSDGLSNILCRSCFDSIPVFEDPLCDHCGLPLPARAFEDSEHLRCRECGDKPYFLDQVRALGTYEGALRIIHHSFKFEGMESLKEEISDKLVGATPAFFLKPTEVLIPVPLSPERKRERGYNPSESLAIEVSRKTGIPVGFSLDKIKSTVPQMSLTREERFKNPKGAYRVKRDEIIPAKVLLIDDVFTTGSTLEECARVLKKAGAQWVGALVLGRTARY
jgi:ComF family protein